MTLNAGQSYVDADFGFTPPSAIGDTVYWDANGNGQQDWTETGISGVVISLTNSAVATLGGVTYGIRNQIAASLGTTSAFLGVSSRCTWLVIST